MPVTTPDKISSTSVTNCRVIIIVIKENCKSDFAFNLILFTLTSFSKAFNLTAAAVTLAISCNTISVRGIKCYEAISVIQYSMLISQQKLNDTWDQIQRGVECHCHGECPNPQLEP